MGPEIELIPEQTAQVVRHELCDTYEFLSPSAPTEPEYELLQCLRKVIEYYSSPQEFESWIKKLGEAP